MKKIITAAAVCMVILLAAGCGEEKKERPALYDKGLEIVATLSEELNEEYVGFFTSSAIAEIAKELGKQDYSEPESVYQLKYGDGGLGKFLAGIVGTDKIPDEVSEKMGGFSYLANLINAQMGANYLALSSVLTADELFVNEAETEDGAYIYFYKDAYPVLVSYRVGEDGAIYMTGSYIFNDDLKESGMDGFNELMGEGYLTMFPNFIETTQVR